MVSDRQASVHQSLQRRRCDVGCRCASRSSSCRAYSPRLKSAAPKCCDSPSRVSTPRPSFPLLFAQSNFSVSCELPPGQERAVADCVLVDPVLLHLVPSRHLQQPSGERRSSVSRGGKPAHAPRARWLPFIISQTISAQAHRLVQATVVGAWGDGNIL